MLKDRKITRNWIYLAAVFILTVFVPYLSAETIRFAVVTDTQGHSGQSINEEFLPQTVQAVLAVNPPVQFVLVSGDLVAGSDWYPLRATQLQRWRQLVQPWYDAGIEVYPAPGNHDQSFLIGYLAAWQDSFPELPDNGPDNNKKMTYSFDFGSCHVAVINTSAPNAYHMVDIDWLARDLAGSDKPNKFVIGHEPAFPKDHHIDQSLDYYPEARDRFWQTLAQYQVKAYFCGHTHSYDHWMKDGVHQINLGTCDTPDSVDNYLIVDAEEDDVTVSLYNTLTGGLQDQFKLSATAAVSQDERPATTDRPSTPFPSFDPTCLALLPVLIGLLYLGFSFIGDPGSKTRSLVLKSDRSTAWTLK